MAFTVSVILPCHNAGGYVRGALESIAAQTSPPTEVIVINDRSTDDSARQIEASGVELTLLHTDYGNAAAARNAGIDRASGEWIAFLDADDFWYPNHLAEAARLLTDGADAGYVSRLERFEGEGEGRVRPRSALPAELQQAACGLAGERYLELRRGGPLFTMAGCLIRRSALLEVGKLDESQTRRHDIDMWLRVLAGRSWCFNPAVTGGHRRDTPGSLSRQVASREYYALRGLLKLRGLYPASTLEPQIRHNARRACSAALTEGDGESDWAAAKELAWPQLGALDRAVFRVGAASPGLFAAVNRWRRRRGR